MIGLQIKQLFRSKGLIMGLSILLAIGILSIHIGKVFIDRQTKVIELTQEVQTEHLERHVEYIDGHIGLLLYYVKFGFANEQSPLAGLSLGQKDFRQAAQLINIRNLEEQKNTTELLNPLFQLLGNLDLSFVLIYLFPLIIIALCFDLLSEEKESGRWSLLAVQSKKPKSIILSKLLIRFCFIVIAFILLAILSVVYLKLPVDVSLLSYMGIAFLHICFWFSLSWLIVSLDKSSKQNCILLLSVWLLLTTVIPAITNSAVSSIYPIPEAYDTTIDSRDGYHTKWDQPKEPTIEKFKKLYPQYEKYNHPEGASFGWFWYYAMQHMGDEESVEARQMMKEKLSKRNTLTQKIGYFVPSINTQLNLNRISKTGMDNYLNYMNALEHHHEKLRLTFYPKVFEEKTIKSENWSQYKMEYHVDDSNGSLFIFAPLFLASLLLIGLAAVSSRSSQIFMG
jgi:ABC-2 type transport system permease protein